MRKVSKQGNLWKRKQNNRNIMNESIVTSRGQTTLPKAVRAALGVGAGERIRYVVLDNEVHILPVRPLKSLFGALRHDGPPVPLEDMERAIAEGARDL